MTDKEWKIKPPRQDAIDRICDMFTELGIGAKEGEQIMSYMTGMSLGMRAASIKEPEVLEYWAFGWAMGAKHG